MQYFHLKERSVLGIKGSDAKKFLQGLVTNDVLSSKNGQLVYCLFLTPQGKIICDAFVQSEGNEILLDIPSLSKNTLLQKLEFSKLNSDVQISDLGDSYKVYISLQDNITFLPDPRHKDLGFRKILKNQQYTDSNSLYKQYHKIRINYCIPDFHMDLQPEKFFPMELGLQNFNAIDLKKGCYIGQEVVARTLHRGSVKKALRVVKLEFANYQLHDNILLKNDKRKVGIMLGNSDDQALALLKTDISNEDLAPELILANDKQRIKLVKQ